MNVNYKTFKSMFFVIDIPQSNIEFERRACTVILLKIYWLVKKTLSFISNKSNPSRT